MGFCGYMLLPRACVSASAHTDFSTQHPLGIAGTINTSCDTSVSAGGKRGMDVAPVGEYDAKIKP